MSEYVCRPADRPLDAVVRVPGSKSITNRALIVAALADGHSVLCNALLAEDTWLMIEALRALGIAVTVDEKDHVIEVTGCKGHIPESEASLFCGNSGTTIRFCTALVALGQGRFELDGIARMRRRPIGGLVAALQRLGGAIEYLGEEGYPPLVVHARGLRGGEVVLDSPESSQMVSALMLAAPCARGDVMIEIAGALPSEPYVHMTAAVMESFGASVLGTPRTLGDWRLSIVDCRLKSYDARESGAAGDELGTSHAGSAEASKGRGVESPGLAAHQSDADAEARIDKRQSTMDNPDVPNRSSARFIVEAPQGYVATNYPIEPDASNATYFLAAPAIAGGRVAVEGLGTESIQGDVRFVDVLEKMGCVVRREPHRMTVEGPPAGRPLRGIDIDLNDMPDTVLTLAVLALFAEGPTTVRNVASLRVKETDRLAALGHELAKLSAGVQQTTDGLVIQPPPPIANRQSPIDNAAIDTYADHRLAMSFALAGLRIPGLVIKDPECVGKTFPEFFEAFGRIAKR